MNNPELLADTTPQPEQGWRPAEVTPAMQRIAAGYRLAAEQQPEQAESLEALRQEIEWTFKDAEDAARYLDPRARKVLEGVWAIRRAFDALLRMQTERDAAHAATQTELERLRAALAEAEALLRDCSDEMDHLCNRARMGDWDGDSTDANELRRKIAQALAQGEKGGA